MRKIREKKALVTGAAGGIGRAIALCLASEGVELCLVDIDEAGLAEVVFECRGIGAQAVGQRCDVSQPQQVSETVKNVEQRWGGVDILINNAGITYYGQTHSMSDEHWDRLLQINLHAHIQFTRELLESLLARREAHVVNVCSMFGLVGMPKLSAYCVSKFGLVGFSESLRAEYGREGLGVTALCPGFVDTNLFTSAPLESDDSRPKVPPKLLRTTAEHVAKSTVKAIRRNKPVVVVEPFAHGLVGLKRYVPSLLDFALHLGRGRQIKKKMARLQAQEQENEQGLPATIEMPSFIERSEETQKRRAA